MLKETVKHSSIHMRT